MQTSDNGRAQLKMEEGEVLRAYRDVVGVWTIGVGLTAASGVVKPYFGMVITKDQSDALLRQALAKSYEPQVEVAMARVNGSTVERPAQHEFDAGVLFHFNTGAIGRATWVKLWKDRTGSWNIRTALQAWSKAGGKLLPALERRRVRECNLLLDGIYFGLPAQPEHPVWASWALPQTDLEKAAVRTALDTLGYQPGPGPGIDRAAVEKFQRDHALTADGIIGRATLSTLQRAMDARTKAVAPSGAVIATAGAAVAGAIPNAVPHLDAATVAASALWLAAHAWGYRDIVAKAVAPTFPRIATLLRSM